MTAAEWKGCDDPAPMLDHLGPAAPHRKVRLLCVSCCRRLDDLLNHPDARRALDVAERWADGACGAGERKVARRAAQAAAEQASRASLADNRTFSDSAAFAVKQSLHKGRPPAFHICYAAAEARSKYTGAAARHAEQLAQCGLIRDIFGNPFRPIAFNPAWRTSDVVLLASGTYAERAFDRMPILADALQDAGCDSDDLLTHLRDANATHVRGCWALDLVLGKE